MSRTTTRRAVATLSALALSAGALAAAGPAGAAPDTKRPITRGLITPLSADVADDGTVYVTQNFAGMLTRKRPGHKPRTIFTASVPGTEVGAVSERHGVVFFATTAPMEEPATRSSKLAGGSWLHRTTQRAAAEDNWLYRIGRNGKVRKVANLSRHERRHNPDAAVTYGVRGLSDECAADWPTGPDAPPARYKGIVESHPYATYQTKRKTYVADAAANAILSVNRKGRVRTVSVLPGNNIIITPSLADAFGIPDCALGEKYWFEGVPTDVELGKRGRLYVTSLPGGPEDPSLGERGSIFRINPKTGKARRIVEELMSPTGLAIAPNGAMYVAELFANRISRIRAGKHIARPWAKVSMPGDVEWNRRGVYATANVLSEPPNGKVVRWRR
jgi:hypothetical protein